MLCINVDISAYTQISELALKLGGIVPNHAEQASEIFVDGVSNSVNQVLTELYHQLTRTHTVLTGRKTPMLLQSPCQYTKYCLRAFHCLNVFLLRQNCCAPDSDGFLCDFWFLSRRCVVTHQDEKDKKHRKDTLSGVCALVN